LLCKKRQLEKLAVSQKEKTHISQEILKSQQEWQIDNLLSLPEFPMVDLTASPLPVSSRMLKKSLTKVSGQEKQADITTVETDSSESDTTTPEPLPSGTSPLTIQIALSEQTFSVELARLRGKMVIRKQGEMEMVTVTATDLRMQGSDDDFNAQIETRDQKGHLARYFIRPWNLTCRLRRRDKVVYADLYLGDKQYELCTLRLSS
jgi:hypothetical protein